MRARDFVDLMGVKQKPRAIGHFRHGGGVRARHRAPAGHGFEDRQSESFVKRREHETIAGVVKLQQIRIAHKTGEMDPRRETAGAARLREPSA